MMEARVFERAPERKIGLRPLLHNYDKMLPSVRVQEWQLLDWTPKPQGNLQTMGNERKEWARERHI